MKRKRAIANIIILIFTLGIGFASSSIAKEKTIRAEYAKIDSALAEKCTYFDKLFQKTDEMLSVFYQRLRGQKLVDLGKTASDQDRFIIYQAKSVYGEVWNNFSLQMQPSYSDVLMYFSNSEVMLNTTSAYQLDNFCRYYLSIEKETFVHSINDFIQALESRKFISFKNTSNQDEVYYARKFSIINSNNKIIFLCKLIPSFFEFEPIYDGITYFSDSWGGKFGGTNSGLAYYPDYQQAKEHGIYAVDNTIYRVFSSECSLFQLVAMVPESRICQKANSLFVLIAGVVLMIGACLNSLFRYFDKKRLKEGEKVQSLLRLVEPLSDSEITADDLYTSLQHLINRNDSLLHQNEQKKRQIDVINENMRSSFIRMIIMGLCDKNELENMLSAFSLDLSDYNRYRVLLIQTDDMVDRELQHDISTNLCGLPCPFEVCNIDDHTLGILLMYKQNDQANYKEMITEYLEKSHDIIKEKLNVSIYCALGRHVENIDECVYSYYSSRTVLLLSHRPIMKKSNSASISNENNNKIMSVIQYIDAGNAEECMKAYDELFYTDEEGALSQEQRDCALILFNLFDDYVANNSVLRKNFMSQPSFDQQINQYLTMIDVLSLLRRFILESCTVINDNGSGRDRKLINQALTLIQQNITDCNLSQAYIADRLAVSSTVLSIKFKNITGINMSQYIRKIRIENAEEMIRHSEKNLSEIAEESGFGSIKSLYRVFKQETGQTPGQYRKNVVDSSPAYLENASVNQ